MKIVGYIRQIGRAVSAISNFNIFDK